MPRISTYTSDTTVEATDKLLGSNAGGATKNFAVQDISKFFKNTNAAGAAAQFVYKFKTDTTQHRATTGTMVGTFSVVGSLQFSKLTAIEVSKFVSGESDSSENILASIASKDILITDVENQNNFGIYTASTPTQDGSTNFYDISLSAVQNSNGLLVNDKFYAIILFGGGADKQAVLTFDSSNFASEAGTLLTETINGSSMRYVEWSHNLSKRPSITVAESGSPEQVAHVPVKYINDNKVRVYFTGTTSGKIYAN